MKVVGWMHTHPTWDAFLTSVDLHMTLKVEQVVASSTVLAVVIDKSLGLGSSVHSVL